MAQGRRLFENAEHPEVRLLADGAFVEGKDRGTAPEHADPELAKTFAVADIYGNVQGDSQQTRDEITCPWNGKVSILNSGGLTITYRD